MAKVSAIPLLSEHKSLDIFSLQRFVILSNIKTPFIQKADRYKLPSLRDERGKFPWYHPDLLGPYDSSLIR
jgi:hypothetical protein